LQALKSLLQQGLPEVIRVGAFQFSREFRGLQASKSDFTGSKVLDFLENSRAFGIVFAVKQLNDIDFRGMKL
jgi:hypothetical protein